MLYWVSDPNPARKEQIALFHEWLRKQGLVTTDGLAAFEVRLDSANNDVSKKIIQGVGGVSSELIDLYDGGQLQYFQEIGLLHDLTESAKGQGFDLSQTWASIEPEITSGGRQFAFPCNVTAVMLWVNRGLLKQLQVEVPPSRWTLDDFERIGRAFVAAANPPGTRDRIFFCSELDLQVMHRSLGLSMFNETMTRCMLDDPRLVRCLDLLHHWTYEDRLLPSLADQNSFATQSGYGGSTMQLFNLDRIAMFPSGRYALIQLRKFHRERVARGQPAMDLAVVEPPHGGFPTTTLFTRCTAIYAGSSRRDLAQQFLAYLASEDYNRQIVESADAVPPNPRYTRIEEYRRPPQYPHEWGLHEPFADAVGDLGIGGEYSPFVLRTVAARHFDAALKARMAGLLSSSAAAAQAAARINDAIEQTLREHPRLRPQYDALLEQQRQIDEWRRLGRPVPPQMIRNPFLRRFHQASAENQP